MVGIEKIPESKLRWNTNEETLQYLSYASINPQLMKKKHVIYPKNGAMLLYDRTKVQYKSDGYSWKKRKDGKNVREDHMKLKVNGVECLYGSYAHNEVVPNFHRRCYWKLKTPRVVLVHYLYVAEETQSGPPTMTQLQHAISQLHNIFNVPENTIFEQMKSSMPDIQLIYPSVTQPASSPNMRDPSIERSVIDAENTKASQLMLILRRQKNQLKTMIHEDQNGHSEDKDTQTERDCNNGVGVVACTNALTNACTNTCTDVRYSNTCTDVRCNVTCSIPSSSRHNIPMETDDRMDEVEANSVLISKNNPLLSNSGSVVDDLTSLLDPIHPCNGIENGGTDDKNDCDMFSHDSDMAKYDLSSLKDKDAKLFELFEEAELACNGTCPTPDIPLQPLLHPIHDEPMGQENIPEVGQKRKHSPAARQVSSVNSLAKQSSQPRPTKPDYPSPLYSQPEDEPVLPTAEFKVEISTVSPDWSYLVGGEKVVLVGDWELMQGRCCVLFGNTMVPAQHLRNGVIQVICPASSHPGVVTVHIVSEGVIITTSDAKFAYRGEHSPGHWLQVVDSNFKYSLINRLEALESQVQMMSSTQYTGDLQTRMCSITLPILRKLSRSLKPPRPPRGLCLIHLAAAVGYTRLVLILLKFPELPECNPCSLDDMGNNALVWACTGGHTSAIYVLLTCCPQLRGSRDGWGRLLKEVYNSSVVHMKDNTAARTIQMYYRTYKQKKLNAAATRIQSRFRTYKQQCNFEQMRRAVVIIQQSYRDHMKTKEVAAKTIQRCWRQTSTQKRVLTLTSNTGFY